MRISDWSSDVCSSDLILEFLPYRKRDGTAPRDESTYPVFAAAGYAGVRVDPRGSGESEGIIDDEYSPRELADARDVIARSEESRGGEECCSTCSTRGSPVH